MLVFVTQRLLARWLTPRLRYALILLIFARLLLPVAPRSPLSLENLFRHAAPPKSGQIAAVAPTPLVSVNPPPAPDRSSGAGPVAANGLATMTFHLSLVEWLSLAWAAGFIGLLTLGVRRYFQWKQLLAQAQVVSDPYYVELLDRARADMGVRQGVKLLVVPGLSRIHAVEVHF